MSIKKIHKDNCILNSEMIHKDDVVLVVAYRRRGKFRAHLLKMEARGRKKVEKMLMKHWNGILDSILYAMEEK